MKLFVALLAGLILAAPAAASEQRPTQADLEDELICPVCAPQTLDQSDAPVARQMKRFIAERIAAGDTKSEIKAKLVDEYSRAVLAAPPREGFDLLAWLLPLAGIVAGAALLGVAAWRWTTTREPTGLPQAGSSESRPLDPALERRLDDELARFDA